MNIIQNGLSDYIKDTIGKMVEVSTLMKRVRLSCEEPKNMWEFPPIVQFIYQQLISEDKLDSQLPSQNM